MTHFYFRFNFQPSFRPARDIQILKHLQDVSAMEKESVTLVCEVNLEDVDGKWFKISSRIKSGDNIRIRQEGNRCCLNSCNLWFRPFIALLNPVFWLVKRCWLDRSADYMFTCSLLNTTATVCKMLWGGPGNSAHSSHPHVIDYFAIISRHAVFSSTL